MHMSVVHLVISKSPACGCSALHSLLFVNRLHVGACVGLYDGARILAPSRVSMGQEAFTQLLQYTFLPSSARKGEQQSLHTLQLAGLQSGANSIGVGLAVGDAAVG